MKSYDVYLQEEAYKRGYQDYVDCSGPGCSCPYEYGTIEFTDWNLGWDDAMQYEEGSK